MDNNNKMNNQIDDYTKKGQEYIGKAEKKANEFLSKANDVVHDVVDKTNDMAEGVANKTNDMAEGVANKTSNMVEGVANKTSSMAEGVANKTSDMAEDVANMVKKKKTYESKINDSSGEYCCGTSFECFEQSKTTIDYIKDYAKEHPVATATAVSATALTGLSLVSPKTRKITVPVAKYAVKQQAKFTLGVGMLAMTTYLSNRSSFNSYK